MLRIFCQHLLNVLEGARFVLSAVLVMVRFPNKLNSTEVNDEHFVTKVVLDEEILARGAHLENKAQISS